MKSKQTENYMETLDKETTLEKGFDTIASIKIVNELLGIRKWISGEINKLEYKELTELQYCESNARLTCLQEMEEIINLGIKHNSIKE